MIPQQLVTLMKNFTFRSKDQKEKDYWKLWFQVQQNTIKPRDVK